MKVIIQAKGRKRPKGMRRNNLYVSLGITGITKEGILDRC
jgi:hypothetical protein